MSKDCKIVEDLLPLYHDGVCSAESREMVEQHLAQCERCREVLAQIDTELLSPGTGSADIQSLKSIARKFLLSQRKALITGIVVILSLFLIAFAANTI